jgi:DNA adenine methylase
MPHVRAALVGPSRHVRAGVRHESYGHAVAAIEESGLFEAHKFAAHRSRPAGQLLKWVGNKQRYAEAIAQHLPPDLGTYFEPFVGTGAVLATVQPERGVAGDSLSVLVDVLKLVQSDPECLVVHYDAERAEIIARGKEAYEEVKARFNARPNPEDLLVLSRTCYGGVVRFTRSGAISTPMGPHKPMGADKLMRYMREWRSRLMGVEFVHQDFADTMAMAGDGDTIYCDPPYVHGQSILYGAQDFRVTRLWESVAGAVSRGARVAVSLDGYRRSGERIIDLGIPKGLFERELLIERGGCMLRRFQMNGSDMAQERVADRLLLSW